MIDPVAPFAPESPAHIEGDPPHWQTLSTEVRFRSRWITVAEDQVLLPDGRTYGYTRLEPAGIGVGVVAFDDSGRILLEREYRHGVGQVVWQIPGGLADKGEEHWQTAIRELREETGYAPTTASAENVHFLGTVWDNPGYGVAASNIYLVRDVRHVGDTQRDEGEFVSLHWVDAAWLKQAVRTGVIQDRVVVAAVAYLLLNGWLA